MNWRGRPLVSGRIDHLRLVCQRSRPLGPLVGSVLNDAALHALRQGLPGVVTCHRRSGTQRPRDPRDRDRERAAPTVPSRGHDRPDDQPHQANHLEATEAAHENPGEWQKVSVARANAACRVVRELALRSGSLGARSFESGSARAPYSDQTATNIDLLRTNRQLDTTRLSLSWLSCHGSQPRIQDPTRRTDVLKVRSDAKPDELVGRLENMVTGQQREFASGQEPAGITAANQAPPPRQKHSLLGTQRRARQYESIAPCRGGVSFRNPSSPTVARSSAVVSHRDEGGACVLDKLLDRTGMRQLT